jgi:hypothetical protein
MFDQEGLLEPIEPRCNHPLVLWWPSELAKTSPQPYERALKALGVSIASFGILGEARRRSVLISWLI